MAIERSTQRESHPKVVDCQAHEKLYEHLEYLYAVLKRNIRDIEIFIADECITRNSRVLCKIVLNSTFFQSNLNTINFNKFCVD